MNLEPEQNVGMYEISQDPPQTGSQKFGSVLNRLPSKAFSILQTFVIISAILVVFYLVLITPHQVDGLSMYPTYQDNQYLIANKLLYQLSEPKRGDVIIFKYSETRDFIKRVIGIAGDTISITDGKIRLNGELLDESEYLEPSVVTGGAAYLREGQTITVPDGHIFVCGDNRPHSSDSRVFGPIKIEQVKGKAWFVIYPISDLHLITDPDYDL